MQSPLALKDFLFLGKKLKTSRIWLNINYSTSLPCKISVLDHNQDSLLFAVRR